MSRARKPKGLPEHRIASEVAARFSTHSPLGRMLSWMLSRLLSRRARRSVSGGVVWSRAVNGRSTNGIHIFPDTNITENICNSRHRLPPTAKPPLTIDIESIPTLRRQNWTIAPAELSAGRTGFVRLAQDCEPHPCTAERGFEAPAYWCCWSRAKSERGSEIVIIGHSLLIAN